MSDETRACRLLALALLGLLVFNFPVLIMIDQSAEGGPGLIIYLFMVWGVMIGVLALLFERRGSSR